MIIGGLRRVIAPLKETLELWYCPKSDNLFTVKSYWYFNVISTALDPYRFYMGSKQSLKKINPHFVVIDKNLTGKDYSEPSILKT